MTAEIGKLEMLPARTKYVLLREAHGGVGFTEDGQSFRPWQESCGVPHPGLLTAVAFVLSIAQLGPFPVLIPAVIWMYSTGSFGWATALLVWSVPVGLLDNFLRPVLISRGVDLPILLIFAGVIGGLIAFGVIGLFVGPVILAVTYRSLQAWTGSGAP